MQISSDLFTPPSTLADMLDRQNRELNSLNRELLEMIRFFTGLATLDAIRTRYAEAQEPAFASIGCKARFESDRTDFQGYPFKDSDHDAGC